MSKIHEWALAIQAGEGWYKGSRSFRNCNPGNLRWANQANATGKDKNGFAVFPDYETGFEALCHQLTIACNGKSEVYHPWDTLYEFFETFAPSFDNNNPKEYAERIAAKLGVEPTLQIKELL